MAHRRDVADCASTGVSTACSNATATGVLRWAVSTPNMLRVAADGSVTVEIVVVIDVYVVVCPSRSPPHRRSKIPPHHSNAERNRNPAA